MALPTSLPMTGKDSVPHPTDEAHGAHRGRAASSKTVRKGGVVLSSHERSIWDDVQRSWAEEAEKPRPAVPARPRAASRDPRAASRDQTDPPAAVVAGAWITIFLVFVGAMTAVLTVGVATAIGWALSHNWPRLSRLWRRSSQ
jgi:hypothetical protein